MSPIKGLTDTVAPAFPRLGKLRKGEAKPDANRPGRDLPGWFRFTSERKDVVAAFIECYGNDPATFNVYLPHRTVDANFQTCKEEWAAGGLRHRCDGETCSVWQDEKGEYHTTPRPCPGGCKEVGRLDVIMPELIRAGHVGYVTMETHSINDIRSIYGSLRAVEEARNGDERGLMGIQFTIYRVLERISAPGADGKRVRRDKWLVKIVPAAEWVTLQIAMTETPKLAASIAKIEAPEDDDVIEEITAEDEPTFEPPAEATGAPSAPPVADLLLEMEAERDRMRRQADDFQRTRGDARPTEAQRKALIMLINEATGAKGDVVNRLRHMFLEYAFGDPSTEKITWGQAKVLFNLLNDPSRHVEGKEIHCKPEGAEIVRRMIRAQQAKNGQLELL